MVRGRSNFYSGARQMFRESRMCSQTIYCATKGEITGMIAACNGNFINPGRAVFARERCDILVWRASQYFQDPSKTCCNTGGPTSVCEFNH